MVDVFPMGPCVPVDAHAERRKEGSTWKRKDGSEWTKKGGEIIRVKKQKTPTRSPEKGFRKLSNAKTVTTQNLKDASQVLAGISTNKAKEIARTLPQSPEKEPVNGKKLPVSFGKSKVSVEKNRHVKWSTINSTINGILQNSLSDDLPGADDLADMAGAPDKSTVTLSSNGVEVEIQIEHPDFQQTCIRKLKLDSNGNPYMYNEIIDIKKESQGKGLGTTVFGREVETALEFGVHYIKCHAARWSSDNEDYFNGYYTWPLLGYDQDLSVLAKDYPEVANAATKEYPGVKTVLDIIERPGGKEWWKKNGTDLEHAKFDLSEGSRSLQVFSRYLKAREAKKAKVA